MKQNLFSATSRVLFLHLVLLADAQAIVVSNTNDVGAGSLRQALADASSLPGADTIVFDASLNGATIAPNGPQNGSAIDISDTGGVTIDATNLPAGLTIKGIAELNPFRPYRVFSIATGSIVTFRGLTIANGGGSGFSTGSGGAITNSGTLALINCTLSGNRVSGNGGAIANSGTLALTNCTFTDNRGFSGFGGAILNFGGMTLTDCTFTGNFNSYGGAVSGSGTMMLMYCTFTGNYATGGGAIHGSGTATNCTFTTNSGSAITTTGLLRVIHCTISGNTAGDDFLGDGGGVTNFLGSLQLENSVVAGNHTSGGASRDIQNRSTLTLNGANIIQVLVNSGTINGSGTANAVAPLLAPLGNYGGSTKTMALLPGSPARNAAVGSTATRDQRGFPIVNTPDIGAYEAGTFTNFDAWAWESLPVAATASQHATTFDFDGDGVNNLNEWLALTNPADPASYVRITQIVRVGSNLEVTFPSVLGRSYTVESTTDFTTWTPLGGITAGTGNPVTLSIGPLDTFLKYFLRVRVGP